MAFSRGRTQVRLAAISVVALFTLDWCGSNGDAVSRSYKQFLTHTSNERRLLTTKQGGYQHSSGTTSRNSMPHGEDNGQALSSHEALSQQDAKGSVTPASKLMAADGHVRQLLRLNKRPQVRDTEASYSLERSFSSDELKLASRLRRAQSAEDLGNGFPAAAQQLQAEVPKSRQLAVRALQETLQEGASRPLSSISGARAPRLAPSRAPPQPLFAGNGIPELFAEHTQLRSHRNYPPRGAPPMAASAAPPDDLA